MLPLKLSTQWEMNVTNSDEREKCNSSSGNLFSEESATVSCNDEYISPVNSDEKDEQTDLFSMMKDSFLKAFRFMDKELRVHPGVDCFCSGTTAVTLIKQVKCTLFLNFFFENKNLKY